MRPSLVACAFYTVSSESPFAPSTLLSPAEQCAPVPVPLCHGHTGDWKHTGDTTVDKCCKACEETEDCASWILHDDTATCNLKQRKEDIQLGCDELHDPRCFACGVRAPPPPPTPPPTPTPPFGIPIALTYRDCGKDSTHVKITGLKPDSIRVPGKAAVVGSGVLDADQTAAHFSLKVKKGIVPLFTGKGNICEDTRFDLLPVKGLEFLSFTVKGLECPIAAGDIDVEVDLKLLDPLFEDDENSLITIHIDADADDTGDQVLCLNIDASLAANGVSV